MKQTRILMGMPVTVEIIDAAVVDAPFEKVFDYFRYIDEKFSTYKGTSEISAINKGLITEHDYSEDMRTVLALSEDTKSKTHGYFDILTRRGTLDPSGLVKGWAIYNASKILTGMGYHNFYVDAGGDIQAHGRNSAEEAWQVGIRDPFSVEKRVVKVVHLQDRGIATSGTYIRGDHIYDPHHGREPIREIVSLTVIGPNVYEADRFATAAFAMGKKGILYIEHLDGCEGYMIDAQGRAVMTTGFEEFTRQV